MRVNERSYISLRYPSLPRMVYDVVYDVVYVPYTKGDIRTYTSGDYPIWLFLPFLTALLDAGDVECA
jgi:hypothetical protein